MAASTRLFMAHSERFPLLLGVLTTIAFGGSALAVVTTPTQKPATERFAGSTPCDVTLRTDPVTRAPATYELNATIYRHVLRTGTWDSRRPRVARHRVS